MEHKQRMIKNDNNENNDVYAPQHPPSLPEVRSYFAAAGLTTSPEGFWRHYDGSADGNKSCRYVEIADLGGCDDEVAWYSYSDEYNMHPRNHRVIAWMPLPEPYGAKST